MKYVYHSSKIQNLKIIEPRVSTHGNSYVYAMISPEFSALFLGDSYDLINQIELSRDSKKLVIIERFKNSLEVGYKNFNGSIYTLSAENFKEGITGWKPELVSEYSEKVLSEEKIPDALDYILKLEKLGKINIYRYPNISDFYTEKTWYEECIEKAVSFAKNNFIKIESDMKKYHPEKLDDFYNAYNKN